MRKDAEMPDARSTKSWSKESPEDPALARVASVGLSELQPSPMHAMVEKKRTLYAYIGSNSNYNCSYGE